MVYKQIVNADALSSVITMPPAFKNKRVEVIIREAPNYVSSRKVYLKDISCMMDGSITQSLVGIIPNNDKSLDDYRAEKLSKYECID
jgi:hypothetical protein